VLQRLHVLLEIGDPRLRLGYRVMDSGHRLVKLDLGRLIVDQFPDRPLTVVDLGADRA
jgi:hypothetical protein